MHVRYSASLFRLWLCLLALAGVQVAHAGFAGGQWSTGYTVDWKTGVTYTSSQWNPGGSPSSGNTRWATSGGLPAAYSTGRLPVGKDYIDVQARTLPDRAKLGAAFGRFFRKSLPVLSTAYALKDLASEIGFIINPDGSLQKQDPSVCTVAPCYDFQALGNTGSVIATFPTLDAACSYQATRYEPGSCQPMANPENGWNWVTSTGYTYYQAVRPVSKTPASEPAYMPATEQDFSDAIANKTSWPADSKLPAAMKDLADSGEPIEAPSPTLTGPTTKTGPTTTTTNPDGTTSTKSETYNITYNGNTVNYTITTVTNNNGLVTTETKQAEPPTDVCEKNPNSVGCQNLDTPTSDTLNKKTQAFTVTAVAFASSSVCPSPLSFSVRGSSYSVSYQPMCDRLAMLRTLFLAIAGVLAAFIVADSFRVQ